MDESPSLVLSWRELGPLESCLEADGAQVGKLIWTSEGGRFTLAATEEEWTFSRTGLITPKIVAKSKDPVSGSARLTLGWRGGGAIELRDGNVLRLTPKGFWRTEWKLTDSSQNRVLTIRPKVDTKRTEATVEVGRLSLQADKLNLLAALCWYSILSISLEKGYDDGAVAATLGTVALT